MQFVKKFLLIAQIYYKSAVRLLRISEVLNICETFIFVVMLLANNTLTYNACLYLV